MKERPILFNDAMVRAILEGRKTQTRRVVKPQHAEGIEIDERGRFRFMHAPTCEGFCDYACAAIGEVLNGHIGWTPWGSHPGRWGRLWVREAWCPRSNGAIALERVQRPFYRATDGIYGRVPKPSFWKWRPSIHMPRWASRITLEITSVRVERLNDISDADCMAEGLAELTKDGKLKKYDFLRDGEMGLRPWQKMGRSPKEAFTFYWADTFGEDAWCENPWVWVIEFKRIEPGHAETLPADGVADGVVPHRKEVSDVHTRGQTNDDRKLRGQDA